MSVSLTTARLLASSAFPPLRISGGNSNKKRAGINPALQIDLAVAN